MPKSLSPSSRLSNTQILLRLAVECVLTEGSEVCDARVNRAGHRIERRVMLTFRFIESFGVEGEFISEAVEIDAFTASDKALHVGAAEDEVGVLTPSGEAVQTCVSLTPDGTAAHLIPSHPWRAGEHCLVISERLEDVCGNRLGEALDHDQSEGGRPRAEMINFTPRSANAPSSAQAAS